MSVCFQRRLSCPQADEVYARVHVVYIILHAAFVVNCVVWFPNWWKPSQHCKTCSIGFSISSKCERLAWHQETFVEDLTLKIWRPCACLQLIYSFFLFLMRELLFSVYLLCCLFLFVFLNLCLGTSFWKRWICSRPKVFTDDKLYRPTE